MRAYDSLVAHFAKINHFEGARSMLHWDGAAMMPMGGAEARSGQISALSVLIHQMTCDPKVQDWLHRADAEVSIAMSSGDNLDLPWAKANLYEIRRALKHASAVPENLVQALSEAGSKCEMVWREARAEDDFNRLQPYLEEVLKLTREVAAIKAEALGVTPYEALLDQYEPGASESSIDAAFAQLSLALPSLIEDALEAQARRNEAHPIPGLYGPFAVQSQRELGLKVMGLLGFDFDHGRLDISHHPFCGGTPSDVRITTRYNEQQFTQSLMGVIHETGHALYEQGLPNAYRNLPVGKARGMSVHESQSLFWEMQVGRSESFISVLAPLVAEAFGGDPLHPSWSVEGLRREYTKVERSLIRVDADEVTYPAHVILRYDLERSLLNGSLEIADLPEAWNSNMQRLVGITPPSNRDGCMQDIHWMDGAFGYFPTYTLGAMTAAQLFESVKTEMPDVHEQIKSGELQTVLSWLRDKVHSKGSSLSTDELLTQATGRPLEVTPFLNHLRSRYVDEVLEGISRAPTAFNLSEDDVQLSNTGVRGTEEIVNDALELVSEPPQAQTYELGTDSHEQNSDEPATHIGAFDGIISPLGEELDSEIFDSIDIREMELELDQLEISEESDLFDEISSDSSEFQAIIQSETQLKDQDEHPPELPVSLEAEAEIPASLETPTSVGLDLAADEHLAHEVEQQGDTLHMSPFDSFDDIDLNFDDSENTELNQELELKELQEQLGTQGEQANQLDSESLGSIVDDSIEDLANEFLEDLPDLLEELPEEAFEDFGNDELEDLGEAFEQANTQAIYAHLQTVAVPSALPEFTQGPNEIPPEPDKDNVQVWSLEGELQLAAELNEALSDLDELPDVEALDDLVSVAELLEAQVDSPEESQVEPQVESVGSVDPVEPVEAVQEQVEPQVEPQVESQVEQLEAVAEQANEADYTPDLEAQASSLNANSYDFGTAIFATPMGHAEFAKPDVPVADKKEEVAAEMESSEAVTVLNFSSEALEAAGIYPEQDDNNEVQPEVTSELSEILSEALAESNKVSEIQSVDNSDLKDFDLEEALDLDLGVDPGPSAYEVQENLSVDLSEDLSLDLADLFDDSSAESGFEKDTRAIRDSAQEAIDLMDSYQPLPGSEYARPKGIKERVRSIISKTTKPSEVDDKPQGSSEQQATAEQQDSSIAVPSFDTQYLVSEGDLASDIAIEDAVTSAPAAITPNDEKTPEQESKKTEGFGQIFKL